MKPSPESVAARLGLAATGECAHVWYLHGKLHRARGGRGRGAPRQCMAHKCGKCGAIQHTPLSRAFD
jgi:hypothetical protein